MELSRTQKSLKNAIASIVFQAVTIASNFAIKTIFIKYLGIQYAGISALFSDILSILSIAELGFGTAMGYALYRPLYENDTVKIARLMKLYKKIYAVVMIVILAGGLLCLPILNYIVSGVPDIHESIHIIFTLYIMKTAATYFLMYKSILLDANQQKNIVSQISSMSLVVSTVIEIIILVYTQNYYLYMTISILCIVASNYITSVKADKLFALKDVSDDEPLPKEEKKEMFKNVRALAIYKVGGTLQRSVDSIIISICLGTQMVGFVSNYRLIVNYTSHLFAQIFEAMKASTGNLAAADSSERQYEVFKKMCFLAFVIGNTVCTCLFVLLNPFVNIWLGGGYVLGMDIVALLVLDAYILTMTRPYENFRIANALFVQGKYRPVAMVIINIVASLVLAKYYGVEGILFATIIARVSTHVWFDPWLIYRRVFKKPFMGYLTTKAKYLFVVVLSCAATYLLCNYISIANVYADFVFKAVMSVVIPNAILIAVYYKSNEYKGLKQTVLNLIKR